MLYTSVRREPDGIPRNARPAVGIRASSAVPLNREDEDRIGACDTLHLEGLCGPELRNGAELVVDSGAIPGSRHVRLTSWFLSEIGSEADAKRTCMSHALRYAVCVRAWIRVAVRELGLRNG
jgi:hypothetical protein